MTKVELITALEKYDDSVPVMIRDREFPICHDINVVDTKLLVSGNENAILIIELS